MWYTNRMLLHGMTEVDAVLATHNLSGTSWRGKPDEHVHNGLGYSLLRGDWVFR
ncbi:MAG: hypothetical protein H6738_09705 [Alphaproteobacteria bacterium]|nr:hypothetical protein [Alphaproteobacteria bacterium]